MIRFSVLALLVAAATAVTESDFLAFGTGAGDAEMDTGDDGCPITFTTSTDIIFFGLAYNDANVARNGILSFGGCTGSFSVAPFPTTSRPSMAVYWADVDLRQGTGALYGRTTTDAGVRSDFSSKLQGAGIDFTPAEVVVATWDGVGYWDRNHDKLNTFQAAVGSDGIETYAIFLYADIQWTTGDFSGGSGGLGGTEAQVGFDAGDSTNFFNLPESQTPDIINIGSDSNVGVPGMFVFKVSDANVGGSVSGDPIFVDFAGHRFIGGNAPNTNYLLYESADGSERIEFLTAHTKGLDHGFFMHEVSLVRAGCGKLEMTAADDKYATLVEGPECFDSMMARGDMGITSVTMTNGAVLYVEPHMGNGFSFLNVKLLGTTAAFKAGCSGMLCSEAHEDILA